MTIYPDILFLINFFQDFLLIRITADIMGVDTKWWRTILSAISGGVLATLFFIIDTGYFNSAVISFVIAVIMSGISYSPCRFKEILKRSTMFFFTSCFMSGMLFLFMRLMGGGMVKNSVFYISSLRLFVVSASVYFLIKIGTGKLKRRISSRVKGVVLEQGEKRVRVEGLIDTGNGLFDPVTKKPVILAEIGVFEKLFGKGVTENNINEWVELDRIRLIPYTTIDTKGYLTGVVIDKIYIDGKCQKRGVAAICNKKLKYPVILNAGM